MASVNKRELIALVERGGLVVEGNETVDDLTEALGWLVMRRPGQVWNPFSQEGEAARIDKYVAEVARQLDQEDPQEGEAA